MNAAEAEAAVKAIPYPRRAPGKTKAEHAENLVQRAEYYKAISEVEGKFRNWLAREYAPWLAKETQDLIWAKAWEYGHSHGYIEVENHYADLADFAEDVVDQNKER